MPDSTSKKAINQRKQQTINNTRKRLLDITTRSENSRTEKIISHCLYERSIGDIVTNNNGQEIVHGPTNRPELVHSRKQFSEGQYRIRLKIKQLRSNEWISIGIMPKKSSAPSILQNKPTIYGQIERHGVFFYGVHQRYNGYNSNYGTNDEVVLIVDCDRHTICLTNGRTDENGEILVDLAKYPFPWVFSAVLYKPDDRVSIFSP